MLLCDRVESSVTDKDACGLLAQLIRLLYPRQYLQLAWRQSLRQQIQQLWFALHAPKHRDVGRNKSDRIGNAKKKFMRGLNHRANAYDKPRYPGQVPWPRAKPSPTREQRCVWKLITNMAYLRRISLNWSKSMNTCKQNNAVKYVKMISVTIIKFNEVTFDAFDCATH